MSADHSHGIEQARRIYAAAPYIQNLGAQVVEVTPGRVVAEFALAAHLTQHHGLLHAGAAATFADHTAGAAATTLLPSGQAVLTIEFKLNILRPGRAPRYRCEAEVLKGGRRISVVESAVWGLFDDGRRELQSKATVTLAVVEAEDL
ncbi:MAG TPA: PaaI family thioesterase [Solimonas sp.]|nr:PaaI family thioesterase [Solimonas sp.]